MLQINSLKRYLVPLSFTFLILFIISSCVLLFFLTTPHSKSVTYPGQTKANTLSADAPEVQQATNYFSNFASFMMSTQNTTEPRIKSYKIENVETAFHTDSGVRIVLSISFIPSSMTDRQALLATGGILQTDGSVAHKRVYIMLVKNGTAYGLKAIGFIQFPAF